MDKFSSFIKVPNNGVVMLRIADNVLGEDSWPVSIITLHNGVVVDQVEAYVPHCGYGACAMRGWTKHQVDAWLATDCTGSHPENFYEGHVLYNADTTAELKLLSGKLLRAMDMFSRPPHSFVQPGFGIVRAHNQIINDMNLFEVGK